LTGLGDFAGDNVLPARDGNGDRFRRCFKRDEIGKAAHQQIIAVTPVATLAARLDQTPAFPPHRADQALEPKVAD
jgi:hypothetical protein